MRKFKPFNEQVIRKELLALPATDHKALTVAMAAFQDETGTGYRIKDYGDGLKMITDSGRGQGRGLFFIETEDSFVLLSVYKKEGQKAPTSLLDTAKQRKKKYEQR